MRKGEPLLATVPIRYVTEMCSRIEPAIVARALRNAGIAARKGHVGGFRVTGAQVLAVYETIVRATDDELFAMMQRPVPRGSYATLVRMLTRVRDVAAALEATADFFALFDGHVHWRIEMSEGTAVLSLEPHTTIQSGALLFVHAMLLTPLRTANWLSGHPIRPARLILPHAFAEYASEARFLFGREPSFDVGPPRMDLPAAALRAPIVRAPADVDEWTHRSLRTMLDPAPADSFEARVRGALAEVRPIGDASLEDVARSLAMSAQTLARRLRERGATFQGVKDALRRDAAIAALRTGRSTSSIAEDIGFSEVSAFQRAFKQWTGTTPARYRR
ncbi:helix-turn-helix domain-containing protein [Pendulispora albinea]|uniref:AraC family transcriptional regulator n=1 Tax=Pendulispora albinea TaxID=2741071 RepID=A0ABZ2M5Q0_9BACT